jgi:hypothetical protein
MSSIEISVRWGAGNEDNVKFEMGGIAGYLPQATKVGGLMFEPGNVTNNETIINYAVL